MEALKVISYVMISLTSLILAVTVLMQSSERTGLGSIAGGAETFFGKNKAKSYEGKLALATKISAGVFTAFLLLLVIIG